MIRLLQMLIFGHSHKWVRIEKINVYKRSSGDIPSEIDYVCSCETCGKIRTFRA